MKIMWKLVSEESPKNGQLVLVQTSVGSLSEGTKIVTWADSDYIKLIAKQYPNLHWMPIPMLPGQQEATAEASQEFEEEDAGEQLPSQLTKPKKKESRRARWERAAGDALSALDELVEIQQEFQEWLDNLPENLQDSPVGEKLQAVVDLDLESARDVADEATGADLPMGFGRD